MNIGSYQAFVDFTKNDNIGAFQPIKDCLAQVSKICNCQRQRKAAKSEECNNLYASVVKNSLPTMLDYLKTKTNDSEIIFTQNGGHEIRRFTLR